MRKRDHRQEFLAQNFLRSPRLVRELVGMSSIGAEDAVYEIGAGKGIITAELARVAKRVVAIEKDARLVRALRERFRVVDDVEVVERDFLTFRIAEREYKIFASIPYNITAKIVRKILYDRPVPSEAYLIMQKEASNKFAGRPRETLFSVLAKPFVEFAILNELKRTDFEPVPNVDSVLLRIRRRKRALIEPEESESFGHFASYGFGRWKKNLRSAYSHVFTYAQWRRLAHDLHFPVDATPTDLSFEQWLGLYWCFRRFVCTEKQAIVLCDRNAGAVNPGRRHRCPPRS